MTKKIVVLLGALMALTVHAKELTFGVTVDDAELIPISQMLAHADDYVGKMVTVEGLIVGVCEARGCWMELASDVRYEKLRLKVKDGEMVFPISAKGRKALAKGELQEFKLTLEQTIAYKRELAQHGGEAFDAASVTEPMSFYQVTPIGVRILE